MKDNKNIRNTLKCIKMSEEEEKIIQENDKNAKLSFSSYCIARALPEKALTPEVIIRMQNMLNIVSRKIEKYEPDTAKFLRGEMEDLWSYLK